MGKENVENGITSIIVIPRNERVARYVVNNGAVHASTYDNIKGMIKELVSKENYIKVLDLVSRFRTFSIFVEEGIVSELEFDFDAERAIIKQETIQEMMTPKAIERKLQQERNTEGPVSEKAESLFDSIKKYFK